MQDDRQAGLLAGARKSLKTKPLTEMGRVSLSGDAANCRIPRSLERHCGRWQRRAHVSAIASDQVNKTPPDYIKDAPEVTANEMVAG